MVRVTIYKVKKSVELPKIENRLPDQKTDKRLGSPFNIRKSSNSNLNININININKFRCINIIINNNGKLFNDK